MTRMMTGIREIHWDFVSLSISRGLLSAEDSLPLFHKYSEFSKIRQARLSTPHT